MIQSQSVKHDFGTIAWGAFFLWWGVTELFPSLPSGVGAIGIGVILLSVNAARVQSGIPRNGFSTTLGILALTLGGLQLAGAMLNLPFELPVFAILLIVLGGIILSNEYKESRKQSMEGM